MWELSAPWWELVARALIVYIAVLVLLRIGGKRQMGELTPFDLVLLLILSESVQNAINAGEESVTGGLILAATLIAANLAVGRISWFSRTAEYAIEGRPQVLIRHGKVFPEVMKGARLTSDDLSKRLRSQGCASLDDVYCAILENDGSISVLKHKDVPEQPPGPGVSLWLDPTDDRPV
jgi:uncharacterized membrane protein YcaP (DUF421 family)